MEDTFVISISLEAKEYEFETRILWLGFQHKIEVNMDGVYVLFEPDEERNLRAIVTPGNDHDAKIRELVALIGRELEARLMS